VARKSEIRAGNIRLKGGYEKPECDDGARTLIDRLWPRGASHRPDSFSYPAATADEVAMYRSTVGISAPEAGGVDGAAPHLGRVDEPDRRGDRARLVPVG
jgi:hypothetical protein